jgi:hypothetical protein
MQKLTRLLSSRLYKVEYELYPDTKYRLIEELPAASSNRYSTHFNANSAAGVSSSGNSARLSSGSHRSRSKSRHLSMQDKQEPLPQDPIPEGSVSTILRNLSSASLSDIANTFKADRKSTNLASVADEDDPDPKKQLPVSSSTKRPPPPTTDKNRRAISIQQLDTLWQDSGSKLLNFVHHGDINTNNPISTPQPSLSKVKDEKGGVDWDHTSASSIEDISTKVNTHTKIYN